MEAVIKHHKARDNSDKGVGKRHKEREVLGWFVQEGTVYRQSCRTMREILTGQEKEQKDDL